ncbi:hypothetical protein ACFW35_09150 [Fictibacillus sp. NPDC058756]|uniref:hypothetical protein n=1 Tax=Fictibacillus sp. NPDC058756 TaxID=3346625 RepID=UPI0036AF090B
MSEKFRAYFNILALAAVILVNYLANALPLNGNTTGALSALFLLLIMTISFIRSFSFGHLSELA